ncbi:angiopoietin-related protein 7-like [Saccostrea echinata]|uniref:angiopoietin-related protein 7-like n=1 Tax=Saccostrea echinata TaxID=191078 RepID=UPI002A841C7C|nr:angiopoietin-related protein 7-like [Saccostrea echinata]
MDAENKFETGHLIGSYQVMSLTACVSMCTGKCLCLGYNSDTRQCRLHLNCSISEMISGTGWKYYTVKWSKDCLELYQKGHRISGVYTINPRSTSNIPSDIFCDMSNSGGGWTVIQKRLDGSTNFTQNWDAYKNGFGNPFKEYWIGNEVIYELTKDRGSSLYVAITLKNGSTLYEVYETFAISNEAGNYRLFIDGKVSGTLGNSISERPPNDVINNMMFSTPERDNDGIYIHCAKNHKGGWWFNGCHDAYLNGPYGSSSWDQPWFPVLSKGTEIEKTAMMIKKKSSP